jgi:hypothetical protein
MDLARRIHSLSVTLVWLLSAMVPVASLAQEGSGKPAPSGEAAPGPRSRLVVSGDYFADTYRQKNFLLGAPAGDSLRALAGNYDAYWTQRLVLRPRFILADNLNVNLGVALAQGIWGLDNETPDRNQPGYTNLFNKKDTFFLFQVDWAYLAYHNAWSNTRWYVGRQPFALGNLLVLDEDATGLQVYRDLPGWNSSLGLGLAKQWEGANNLSDESLRIAVSDSVSRNDNRNADADLAYVEWRTQSKSGNLLVNPFFVWYLDRSTSDSTSFLPDEQGYLDARFRPNVTKASIIGLSAALRRGMVHLEAEVDKLSGSDRARNSTSGLYELHDRNNGDLKGTNIYGRLTLEWPRFSLGGAVAMGSGRDDPLNPKLEGNFNSLRSQGNFYITEVWEDGIALDERGITPQGLGSPFARGYRGLENTRIIQFNGALLLRSNLKLSGSYSMIKSAEALHPWADLNGDNVITSSGAHDAGEYGYDWVNAKPGVTPNYGSATDLGNEIDLRVDWVIEKKMTLSLRAGSFSPGIAGGYLINGTEKYQEKASEIRLGLQVPIPEFSLGG